MFNGHANEADTPVHDIYEQDQDRSLSEAVLQAVQEFTQIDISKSDFSLYDSIDPDALDNLFRYDTSPETVLEFTVDDMRIYCWGNGGVEIRVTGLEKNAE